jgi:hypothetical protein
MKATILILLLAVAVSCLAQAKKTTKKVWTNDDISSSEPTPGMPKKEVSVKDDLDNAQKLLDAAASNTPREFANRFARDVAFPGRDEWERRLEAAKNDWVSQMQARIDLIRKGANDEVRRGAEARESTSRYQLEKIEAEGISKAADWERKTSSNIKTKSK